VRSGNDPAGKHCVVVGRSNIVGRPMASLPAAQGPRRRRDRDGRAFAHADLGALTQLADILIVAVGRPRTVTRDMVKPGARVVIDDGREPRRGRLGRPGLSGWWGDVDFDGRAPEVASAITPVPGGVGPMNARAAHVETRSTRPRALSADAGPAVEAFR